RALSLNRNNPVYYNDLANLFMDQGKTKKALAMYGKAASTIGQEPWLYGQRAYALIQLGRRQDAIEQYRLEVERYPIFADVERNLGDVLCASGKGA
ncbi:MAG: Tetratricopeptide repeat, partial [Gammaproteobacteria bacterium]|nr:Tetratricopeptide repeat [Gammaproteobacteria bacterium]